MSVANSSGVWPVTTQIANSSAETTVVPAGPTGSYNEIFGWQITNASATACTVTIKDSTGGTTRFVYDIAANGGIVVIFPTPVSQSKSAANWTATCSASNVTIDVNAQYRTVAL